MADRDEGVEDPDGPPLGAPGGGGVEDVAAGACDQDQALPGSDLTRGADPVPIGLAAADLEGRQRLRWRRRGQRPVPAVPPPEAAGTGRSHQPMRVRVIRSRMLWMAAMWTSQASQTTQATITSHPAALQLSGPQRLARVLTAELSQGHLPVVPAGMLRPIAHGGLGEGAELGDGDGVVPGSIWRRAPGPPDRGRAPSPAAGRPRPRPTSRRHPSDGHQERRRRPATPAGPASRWTSPPWPYQRLGAGTRGSTHGASQRPVRRAAGDRYRWQLCTPIRSTTSSATAAQAWAGALPRWLPRLPRQPHWSGSPSPKQGCR